MGLQNPKTKTKASNLGPKYTLRVTYLKNTGKIVHQQLPKTQVSLFQ